jgi:pimeloyl-ACP methyl ester carboxylesterase
VLADTRAGPDTPEARDGRRETAAKVRAEGVGVVVESMLPKLLGETTRREHPEVVERTRRIIESSSPEGVARALEGMAARPDSFPLLPTLEVATLVVVGDEDAITPPAESEKMVAALPNARLAVIPGATLAEFLGSLVPG